MISIVGCNNDLAVKVLYRIIIPRFNLLEDDVELVIGHTSQIFLNENSIVDRIDKKRIDDIKMYCDGFLDGFLEGFEKGLRL